MRRITLALTLVVALACAAVASAAPKQPPLDRDVLKKLWQPIGFFKPGDPIPQPAAPPKPTGKDGTYNPSGHWSAYDTNVFESLNFPGRQPGDTTNDDPPGSGMPLFGFCPPNPQYMPAGRCANHALEYLDYYEATMNAILKDFGGVVRRYKFESPGRTDTGFLVGEPLGQSAAGGETYNIAGVVPGADHPEQEVIVSGHWDLTDAAPAAGWDSSEGHGEVIRIAKIMTDYWRATGTRPSVTVRFMPWGSEESGSYGSADYATNYVADERDALRIRGYFNMDPCSGAYPAYYHGSSAERVPMTLQLGKPGSNGDVAGRFEGFNKEALQSIDEFFADIDDTVETTEGPQPLFTDADRPEIVTAVGGLLLFSSDYANFEALGVPIFNLFPDMFGAHADGTAGSPEGVSILHTPQDNLTTINKLTGPDQTGMTASDGWMKGMELCANLEGRYMLRPSMAGAQTATTGPVAYMEPDKAIGEIGKLHAFDASGTYQYDSVAKRTYTDDSDLLYQWNFGDATKPAFGKQVKHAFKKAATYTVKLTVLNRVTGEKDVASRRVTINGGEGKDVDPDQTTDPGTVLPCQSNAGFSRVSVKPSGSGLQFTGTTPRDAQFAATIYQASAGKKAMRLRNVASFGVESSYKWNAPRLAEGAYIARVVARGKQSRPDQRAFAFNYTGSRFANLKPFSRRDTCERLSYLRLASPVFGGGYGLTLNLATTNGGKVTVTVTRKGKRAARKKVNTSANRLSRVTFPARKLKPGTYKVAVKAGKTRGKLFATRL